MREIEVKARVKDKGDLLIKAAAIGITFSDATSQDDTTYETTTPYDDPNWNIFRIRRQSGKIILTMKYKASSRSRDNHELETIIENAEEMAGMLERIGYTRGVRIRKLRHTAKHNDLELCLDEVDDLGTFIEVEKLAANEADVDAIQATLWQILLRLGIDSKDRVHKGYDTLMHEFLKAKK